MSDAKFIEILAGDPPEPMLLNVGQITSLRSGGRNQDGDALAEIRLSDGSVHVIAGPAAFRVTEMLRRMADHV